MDREKEESEKLIKSETLISPTTPTTTTAATTKTILTTTNDDDTSSESFETWLLVNDKKTLKTKSDDRIELLHNSENEDEAEEALKDSENENFKKIDNDDEDVEQKRREACEKFVETIGNYGNDFYKLNDVSSDGISVISESESMGRISPNPSIVEDILLHPSDTDNENQLRQRTRSSFAADLTSTHSEIFRPMQQPKSLNCFFKDSLSSAVILALNVIKRGLKCTFYVGVGIALLGFFGNVFNPSWQPLHGVMNRVSSLEQLQQKLTDMELQNNLMRAEIDLLDKHVRYLKDKDARLQSSEHYRKEGKAFKAWSGNGDSLKPVDITKDDLKKPYKCPDGSFVEIANMCIEQQPPNKPSIVDQFGHVVENLKEKSEAFKTFEEVAEELHGFDDKFFARQQGENVENKKKHFEKNKPIYGHPKYQPKSEESKLYATHQHDKEEGQKSEYKKFYGKNDSKQKYSKEDKDSSAERKKYTFENRGSHETNHFKIVEKKYGYDKPKDGDSDEVEWLLKHMKYREELRERNQNKGDYKSGEWHDKYLKNREEQRKNKRAKDSREREQHRKKRGDSGESKRSGEKRFR